MRADGQQVKFSLTNRPQCLTPSFDERAQVAMRSTLVTHRFEIYASEKTFEIFIEADFETPQEERRRFALLNISRQLFSEATATAAQRDGNPVLHPRRDE
jgi:hypothetical protein